MEYRRLGRTGIEISALSFGAGPIANLMVGRDYDRQLAVVEHALRVGVNWFDTAATYGDGQSERALGRVLETLLPTAGAAPGANRPVHVATKVRLLPDDLGDIRGAVRRSLENSLGRLRRPSVTLLQLHNAITPQRGDEPTSITPADVLGPRGVAVALAELRDAGLVAHVGLTGVGDPRSLREVVRSGQFAVMQVPYHLLNPSAGRAVPADFAETNYGDIIAQCALQDMGVLAIRVLAGGALAGNPPSPHTLTTPFFPLALYERDLRRAARLKEWAGIDGPLQPHAIRFALAHPHVHSALVGFATPREIDEALRACEQSPPPVAWEACPFSALDGEP